MPRFGAEGWAADSSISIILVPRLSRFGGPFRKGCLQSKQLFNHYRRLLLNLLTVSLQIEDRLKNARSAYLVGDPLRVASGIIWKPSEEHFGILGHQIAQQSHAQPPCMTTELLGFHGTTGIGTNTDSDRKRPGM